jgi:UDP-glucose 4-epimerase
MKIIIAGASGFIGSSLVKNLAIAGHKVTAISRKSAQSVVHSFCETVVTSLSKDSLSRLLSINNPDVFIYCIGSPTVRFAQCNPQADFNTTVLILSEVLNALRVFSPSTHFIFLSSGSVYGDKAGVFLDESLTPDPVSVYGSHKLMAELLIQQYNIQFGLKTLIVRPFSVYGPELRKQVIFDLGKKFITKPNELSVVGTGQELRDFIYIDDFVSVFKHFVDFKITGIINVASGIPTSLSKLVSLIASRISPNTHINFTGESFPENPKSLVADISRLKSMGIFESIPLEIGIPIVCDSLLCNLDNFK